MKAMKLTGINQMKLFDVPIPEIEHDTDVLIKMTHIGVCGSDIHYYSHGRIGNQIVDYPFTVGHEGAGIIEKAGSKVNRVKPGDRIAIDPAMPCENCDQCLAGRPHTCRRLKFLGCPGQAEGCLSEYIVMPQNSCFPLSDNTSLIEASLSEPLSIGYYGMKLSGINAGVNIGILGAGPIGLSVLESAKSSNCGNIYITDRLEYRLQFAKNKGASWTGNPDKDDVITKINELQPDLLDVVFECCGKQEAINEAISILKPGGKLMIIGIPENSRYSFDVDNMRHKEICIQNVRRQNGVVEQCLELINNSTININDWVTHHFSLSQTKEAFDMVANYHDGVIKAMIEI